MKNILLIALAVFTTASSAFAQSCNPDFEFHICRNGNVFDIVVEAEETYDINRITLYNRFENCWNNPNNDMDDQVASVVNVTEHTFGPVAPSTCYQIVHRVALNSNDCYAEQRQMVGPIPFLSNGMSIISYVYVKNCGNESSGTYQKTTVTLDPRFFDDNPVITWQRFINGAWVSMGGNDISYETCVDGLYRVIATGYCGDIIEEQWTATGLSCCRPGFIIDGGSDDALLAGNGLLEGELLQNEPNPFQNITQIKYALPTNQTEGQIVITEISGRTIKTIALSASSGTVELTAGELSPGVYLYSLVAGNKVLKTNKMVVME